MRIHHGGVIMAGDKDAGKGVTGRNGDKDAGKGTGRNGDKDAGKGEGSGFGGGAGGWVVVAFISPVGVDVPGLAAGILRGESSQPSGSSPRRKALSSAVALAQKEARAQQIKLQHQEVDHVKLQAEVNELKKFVLAAKRPGKY
jgi:hypothetical protein